MYFQEFEGVSEKLRNNMHYSNFNTDISLYLSQEAYHTKNKWIKEKKGSDGKTSFVRF